MNPLRDPRLDAYISGAAEFAQPILRHVRALVHEACPRVVESIKWGMPAFGHAGRNLCHLTAFSPSHRREYIEWIVEAKRDGTRGRRLAATLEWLAKGESRNWKYEKC